MLQYFVPIRFKITEMTMTDKNIKPSLDNPFAVVKDVEFSVPGQINYEPGLYEHTLQKGHELIQRPRTAAGVANIERQHQKIA
jgi:hypothetical protein